MLGTPRTQDGRGGDSRGGDGEDRGATYDNYSGQGSAAVPRLLLLLLHLLLPPEFVAVQLLAVRLQEGYAVRRRDESAAAWRDGAQATG